MKYKYQVVAHTAYYPSSILFEEYEEALKYYNSVKGADHEDAFITLCEIKEFKGEQEVTQAEYDWYLQRSYEE